MKYEDITILKSFEQYNGTGVNQSEEYSTWKIVYQDIINQLRNARQDKIIRDLTDVYCILDNYIEDNYIDIELDIIEFNNKSNIIMYNLDNNNLLYLTTIEADHIVVREYDGQYYKNNEIF